MTTSPEPRPAPSAHGRLAAAAACAALLIGSTAAAAAATDSPARPNILWITSEDNSPYLGCYGDPLAETPHLDQLAAAGVRYRNAFANSPVCSSARSTLITGMDACSLGVLHHRSRVRIPASFPMYPVPLRAAGYYCTNNSKTDYNVANAGQPWDESSPRAHYKNRPAGQPFFAIFNLTTSHESQVAPPPNKDPGAYRVAPDKIVLPPYHPDTPEIRRDWANYYDQMTRMDEQAGQLLEELDEAGLADDTIVFYYSDHGGALPRGKRNLHDSGTRVPLIIRFPERWSHLAPAAPGRWVEQPVSFVDLPATLFSLAGVPIPENFHGRAFAGPQQAEPREYVFLYRGRMDERYDIGRAIRDTRFRYIRNYSPHRPWGQHYSYPFQVLPSMRSWYAAFRAGQCDPVQARYWGPKPPEELYDTAADPFEVRNLVAEAEHASRLAAMRSALRAQLIASRDTGFIPEGMFARLAGDATIYEYAQSEAYPIERIVDLADKASARDPALLPDLISALDDPHPVIRYWGAIGCLVLQQQSGLAKAQLIELLGDDWNDIRVAVAEAVGYLAEPAQGLQTLNAVLNSGNLYEILAALNALDFMVQAGHVSRAQAQDAVRDLELAEPADRIPRYLLAEPGEEAAARPAVKRSPKQPKPKPARQPKPAERADQSDQSDPPRQSAAASPNLIVILADDMGFSDLGCYGGEIETPNLDALAVGGLRFTQFYNAARCCPTRAALLTGLYPHQAGIGHMVANDGIPSYQGYLNDRCRTIAEVLRTADYRTLAVGKWHVGSQPGRWPLDRGFERFWGTPTGGGVYFKDTLQLRSEVFFVHGQERIEPPDDLYVTDSFTDRAIEFLAEAAQRPDQPFFLYLAHIAPHWPLQAKPADIAKYRGRYDIGWDEVRQRRFLRQQQMGLVRPDWQLSPRDPQAAAWSEMSAEARGELAHRMAVYAAQIDCIDQNVGRLVAKLQDLGQLDNTLILFLSDNGCSAEGGPGGFSRGRPGAAIGTGLSYASAGLEWANASDTPFRKFKMDTREGGIASPLIAHWPAGIAARGELRHDPAHVIDLLPTLIELGGAAYPAEIAGRPLLPLEGRSLVPAFSGSPVSQSPRPLCWEHQGNKAVRLGHWKAVAQGRGAWALYDLESDRTETQDLADKHPAKTAELAAVWHEWADRCGVWQWDDLQRHRRER